MKIYLAVIGGPFDEKYRIAGYTRTKQIIDQNGKTIYRCIDRIEADEQLGMVQLAYDLGTLHALESDDYRLDDDTKMQQDFAGI